MRKEYIRVTLPEGKDYFAAKRWARETFGRSKPNNKAGWSKMIWYAHHHFYFSVPEHATAFVLKWL